MNSSKMLVAATFAAVAAFGAQAGEVDLTPLPEFHSTRTVEEVRAEAREAAANPIHGELLDYAAPMLSSTLRRAQVLDEAKVAQRAGQIGHGELTVMAQPVQSSRLQIADLLNQAKIDEPIAP